MVNAFDQQAAKVFDVAARKMGYPCSWTPSQGGEENTARVLYHDAFKAYKITGIDYDPRYFVMEYKQGDFSALKEAVDQNLGETVSITFNDDPLTVKDYFVRKVDPIRDGRTYMAVLEKKND